MVDYYSSIFTASSHESLLIPLPVMSCLAMWPVVSFSVGRLYFSAQWCQETCIGQENVTRSYVCHFWSEALGAILGSALSLFALPQWQSFTQRRNWPTYLLRIFLAVSTLNPWMALQVKMNIFQKQFYITKISHVYSKWQYSLEIYDFQRLTQEQSFSWSDMIFWLCYCHFKAASRSWKVSDLTNTSFLAPKYWLISFCSP